MTERGRKYLSDILIAIDLIESFTNDIDSFEAYTADLKTQSAVERQLGIVGEAVKKFKQECPEEILEYSQQIVGFRNRIIHAYDSIDNSIVWVILKRYLFPLKEELIKKV
ncbi:MAG: HepT-like ribonuclease domain-containing protein [Bacteroidota bacterium]|nr:HepT-like ribonuclease domain-containing protein [Bacteroidota bacterium]